MQPFSYRVPLIARQNVDLGRQDSNLRIAEPKPADLPLVDVPKKQPGFQ